MRKYRNLLEINLSYNNFSHRVNKKEVDPILVFTEIFKRPKAVPIVKSPKKVPRKLFEISKVHDTTERQDLAEEVMMETLPEYVSLAEKEGLKPMPEWRSPLIKLNLSCC